jgi:MHS family proline/betaine transporter-like MFS transporter
MFGYLLFSIPSFLLLQNHPTWWVLLPLVVFYSAEQAVTPAVIIEMFPGKGRYTGISISYNLCMALVGGFAPAINTYLIQFFNNTMIIAYYIFACALVSLLVVIRSLPHEYGVQRSLTAV